MSEPVTILPPDDVIDSKSIKQLQQQLSSESIPATTHVQPLQPSAAIKHPSGKNRLPKQSLEITNTKQDDPGQKQVPVKKTASKRKRLTTAGKDGPRHRQSMGKFWIRP